MEDRDLLIYLMKRCVELEENLEKEKAAVAYWFQECDRLKREKEQ